MRGTWFKRYGPSLSVCIVVLKPWPKPHHALCALLQAHPSVSIGGNMCTANVSIEMMAKWKYNSLAEAIVPWPPSKNVLKLRL